MTKWEYDLLVVDEYNSQGIACYLDEAGQDGWELVSFISIGEGRYKCVFKRPYLDSASESTLEIIDEYLENLKIGGTD